MRNNTEVKIYTDGACLGNPGPGGWGALLITEGHEKQLCGYENNTTNNRMELMAAIKGLEALKHSCDVELCTDSQYVRLGMTTWIEGWQKKGWKKSDNKPVKNADLWKELLRVSTKHRVRWKWVKGHSGIRENELVDQLANSAAKRGSHSE